MSTAKKTPEQKAAEAQAKESKKVADAKAKADAKAAKEAAKNGASKPPDGVSFGGAGQPPAPTEADKTTKFPEGQITGKFHAVQFGGGFVVYNQHGQRATSVVSDAVAKDLVLKNNIAAGIKG